MNIKGEKNMSYNGKGMSIASLVLGILSLGFFWIPFGNTALLVLGIVGIILAVKGKKAAVAAGAPTGLATAGLVLSIIGTVFAGIGFVTCTLCTSCAICAGEGALTQQNIDDITKMFNN